MSKDAAKVGMPEEPLRFTHTSIANAGENITCRQWIKADDYDALRAHCETLHSKRDGAREWIAVENYSDAVSRFGGEGCPVSPGSKFICWQYADGFMVAMRIPEPLAPRQGGKS